jgi:hypothetical protein
VRFRTIEGVEKTGTVIRVNQKAGSIDPGLDEGWWRMSPTLLRHVD